MYIYGLCDPRNLKLRYIGRSKDPQQRLKGHLKEARNTRHTSHKINWIRSLLSQRISPDIFVIDKVPDSEWRFWEPWYVSYFKSIGCDLTNMLLGGEEGEMTDEIRKKISVANTGKILKESTKQKLRELRVGTILTQEHKDKIGLSGLGHMVKEETKLKISKARKEKYTGKNHPWYGKKHKPDWKDKVSKITKELTNTIKKQYAGGVTVKELTSMYKVHNTTIYRILKE